MATGWVKAFHCKTNALEDVHHHHPPFPSTPNKPKPPPPPPPPLQPPSPPTTRKPPLLPLGCGNTTHSLKDVIFLFPKKPTSAPPPPPPLPHPKKPPPPSPSPSTAAHHRQRRSSSSPSPNKGGKLKRPPRSSDPFPTLSELPPGHSSRRVVEIIFSSSWSSGETFPGAVEVLFKVHNSARTVARFEEYRDTVRSRAGPADARCAADGNEMMRFHSAQAGPEPAGSVEAVFDAGVVWSAGSGGGGIKTFSGSGAAHASGGGGRGRRRAMLVCRVIAGRVRKRSDDRPENFESVSVGRGEVVVFDPRAVLPCFLIIYKV